MSTDGLGWRPVLDKEKYREVILRFVHKANNEHLGLTKLHKLLYYVDFDHFERHLKPITGDTYIKQPYGPVPQNARAMLTDMQQRGQITVTNKQVINFTRQAFTAIGGLETAHLSAAEIATVDKVIQRWATQTTNQIVAATHGEAPWRSVEFWEVIPYETALDRQTDDLSDPDADDYDPPPWAVVSGYRETPPLS